jgi:hypothetical protein
MDVPHSLDRPRLFRPLASCLLATLHHLSLIWITTPRRYPNLMHWLPLMLSVQRFLLLDEDKGRKQDEGLGM